MSPESEPKPDLIEKYKAGRRGKRGGWVGLGIIVAASAFLFFGPGLLEGSSTPCGAVALQAAAKAGKLNNPLGAAVAKYFGDPAVASLVRKSHPDFPPEIVCAWIYWIGPGSIYYPEAANRQFEPQPPGTGLEISKIAPARTPDGGLFIEGDVTNISEASQKVPQLRVALRDATAREVEVKIVDAPKAQLLPGEAEHFSATFNRPPDVATGVVVTIAPDGDR